MLDSFAKQMLDDICPSLVSFYIAVSLDSKIVSFAPCVKNFYPHISVGLDFYEFLSSHKADLSQWIKLCPTESNSNACPQAICLFNKQHYEVTSLFCSECRVFLFKYMSDFLALQNKVHRQQSEIRCFRQFNQLLKSDQVNLGQVLNKIVDFLQQAWTCSDSIFIRLEVYSRVFTSTSSKHGKMDLFEQCSVCREIIFGGRVVGRLDIFCFNQYNEVERDLLRTEEKELLKSAGLLIDYALHVFESDDKLRELGGNKQDEEKSFDAVLNITDACVCFTNANRVILKTNKNFDETFGNIVGKRICSHICGNDKQNTCVTCPLEYVSSGRLCREKREIETVQGRRFFDLTAGICKGKGHRFVVLLRDCTALYCAEKKMDEIVRKLKDQQDSLNRKNIAISEMMVFVEEEKRQLQQRVSANIIQRLKPLLDNLKSSKLSTNQKELVCLIDSVLGDLSSSFGYKLQSNSFNLSSRESQICSLVRSGLSSKEIADQLGITSRTVDIHRQNIRKKLGITSTSKTLYSFLAEL